MPIDARIPLGATGVDPNGFINALAAGMKARELQNEADRLARKDELLEQKNALAAAKDAAIRKYGMSARTPEDLRNLYAEGGGEAGAKIEEQTREAEKHEIDTKNAKMAWAKANHELLSRGAAAIVANPTRETALMAIEAAERQGGDMVDARRQLENTPNHAIPKLGQSWGMNAKQIGDMALAEQNANKPVWDSYTRTWISRPGSASTGPAESAPTAPAGPGPELSATEDPAYRYFKNRHGLSDAGAFALSRNLTQESGHRPEAVGDGGKAQGLAQWHPDRWAKLEKWAVENGLDPKSKQAQMDYIVEEAKNYPGFESLKGNDPAALREFIKNYEGYGVEGARFSGLDERAAQGGGPTVPPAPVGSEPVQPPPVAGPASPVNTPPIPAGGYRSPSERDAANDARQTAKDAEAQRVANETLKLRQDELAVKEKRARDAAEAKRRPTPEILAKAREKLQTATIIRNQIEKVKAAAAPLKNSLSMGLGGGLLYTPEGRAFDAAVDGLRPFLRQISRTPGEGSMSDYESKQAESLLPSRNDYEDITPQKLKQIEAAIDEYEAGARATLGSVPEAGGADAAPQVEVSADKEPPLPRPVKVAPVEELDDMPLPGGKYIGKFAVDPSSGIRYRSNGRDWIQQ
jgi:hypothetical protein